MSASNKMKKDPTASLSIKRLDCVEVPSRLSSSFSSQPSFTPHQIDHGSQSVALPLKKKQQRRRTRPETALPVPSTLNNNEEDELLNDESTLVDPLPTDALLQKAPVPAPQTSISVSIPKLGRPSLLKSPSPAQSALLTSSASSGVGLPVPTSIDVPALKAPVPEIGSSIKSKTSKGSVISVWDSKPTNDIVDRLNRISFRVGPNKKPSSTEARILFAVLTKRKERALIQNYIDNGGNQPASSASVSVTLTDQDLSPSAITLHSDSSTTALVEPNGRHPSDSPPCVALSSRSVSPSEPLVGKQVGRPRKPKQQQQPASSSLKRPVLESSDTEDEVVVIGMRTEPTKNVFVPNAAYLFPPSSTNAPAISTAEHAVAPPTNSPGHVMPPLKASNVAPKKPSINPPKPPVKKRKTNKTNRADVAGHGVNVYGAPYQQLPTSASSAVMQQYTQSLTKHKSPPKQSLSSLNNYPPHHPAYPPGYSAGGPVTSPHFVNAPQEHMGPNPGNRYEPYFNHGGVSHQVHGQHQGRGQHQGHGQHHQIHSSQFQQVHAPLPDPRKQVPPQWQSKNLEPPLTQLLHPQDGAAAPKPPRSRNQAALWKHIEDTKASMEQRFEEFAKHVCVHLDMVTFMCETHITSMRNEIDGLQRPPGSGTSSENVCSSSAATPAVAFPYNTMADAILNKALKRFKYDVFSTLSGNLSGLVDEAPAQPPSPSHSYPHQSGSAMDCSTSVANVQESADSKLLQVVDVRGPNDHVSDTQAPLHSALSVEPSNLTLVAPLMSQKSSIRSPEQIQRSNYLSPSKAQPETNTRARNLEASPVFGMDIDMYIDYGSTDSSGMPPPSIPVDQSQNLVLSSVADPLTTQLELAYDKEPSPLPTLGSSPVPVTPGNLSQTLATVQSTPLQSKPNPVSTPTSGSNLPRSLTSELEDGQARAPLYKSPSSTFMLPTDDALLQVLSSTPTATASGVVNFGFGTSFVHIDENAVQNEQGASEPQQ